VADVVVPLVPTLYHDHQLCCFAATLLYTSTCRILVISTAEMTALGEIFLLSFVSFTMGTWL
jgi:hypothetical protein